MNPKISVITVCYNSASTIERTINSVLNQTYQNFEDISVDGKSTDGTMDIVKKYQNDYPDKIFVVSEPDNGIYDAMNKGIGLATGDIVGIVNSDDYYEQDALQIATETFDGYPYEIIYGLLRTIKDNKEVSVYLKHHMWLNDDMITHPTCFITKETYNAFGVYSLKYRYSADYEFMLRMARNEKVVFKPVYSIISNFSIDGASSSIKGYIDTLNLKMEYGLIGKKRYYFELLKSRLAMIMRK